VITPQRASEKVRDFFTKAQICSVVSADITRRVGLAHSPTNLKDNAMVQPRLRIYYGPSGDPDTTRSASEPSSNTVTVPLREVFGWLIDAVHSGRTWLSDFEDDEVTISADLYEVILAYQHYRRPSA
jgi:hypothetical protein